MLQYGYFSIIQPIIRSRQSAYTNELAGFSLSLDSRRLISWDKKPLKVAASNK